jgi:hypothetical protein
MTPKQAFQRLVNKILGKETAYSQQDMIIVEQALTELEELKTIFSRVCDDLEDLVDEVNKIDEDYLYQKHISLWQKLKANDRLNEKLKIEEELK